MDNKEWKTIREVPERLGAGRRAIALQFLLKHADSIQICEQNKGRSQYKAYFDDGVFKGGYEFIFRQADLTPLHVYMKCANTGWPGFNLEWLEQIAEQEMSKSLNPLSGGE